MFYWEEQFKAIIFLLNFQTTHFVIFCPFNKLVLQSRYWGPNGDIIMVVGLKQENFPCFMHAYAASIIYWFLAEMQRLEPIGSVGGWENACRFDSHHRPKILKITESLEQVI